MSRNATRGLLQIGEVADRTGLGLRTIRHNEDVGLLPAAERSPGGFRLYTESTVARLVVIKGMKPLDFTLEQMREVLEVLDALEDEATSHTRNMRLHATRATYRPMVVERVNKLQSRLAGAQSFQAYLEASSKSPGAPHTEPGGAVPVKEQRPTARRPTAAARGVGPGQPAVHGRGCRCLR